MTDTKLKIAVGDIITAYHAGFHRVISIEPREGEGALVRYVQVLAGNGNKARPVQNVCDELWCLKVTEERVQKCCEDECEKALIRRDAVLAFLRKMT